MTELVLSDGAKTVVRKLTEKGYKAYAVGGCVRDLLRGRTPDDYDIATSAFPENVAEVFSAYDVIPTGLKHGTVTVVIDKIPYEITTFRKDGDYLDGRRPDKVEFVDDVKEDLSRRDFTVNAMAYNDDEGLIDPFGGEQDLKNKILRCVGDPVGGYGKLMEKLYRFYKEKVGVKSVKKVIYQKVRHEYLNDASREDVKKGSRVFDRKPRLSA